MADKIKASYESKTTWFGIAVFVLGLLEYAKATDFVASYPIAISAIGLAIVVLRFLTSKPLVLFRSQNNSIRYGNRK